MNTFIRHLATVGTACFATLFAGVQSAMAQAQPRVTVYGTATGGRLAGQYPNYYAEHVQAIYLPDTDVTIEAQAQSPLTYSSSALDGYYSDTVALRQNQLRVQMKAPTYLYYTYTDGFGDFHEVRYGGGGGAQAYITYCCDSLTVYGPFPANTFVPIVVRARIQGTLQAGPANQGAGGKQVRDYPNDGYIPPDVNVSVYGSANFDSDPNRNGSIALTTPGTSQTVDVTQEYAFTTHALVPGQTLPFVYGGGQINVSGENGASADLTVSFEVVVPRGCTVSSQLGMAMDVAYPNTQPSFIDTGDVTAPNSGPQVIPSWATDINPGAPDEADQTLTFEIIANSNPYLFATGPDISPDGTITFTATPGMVGTALITVVLRDDGGTVLNGVDTSTPHTFLITVTGVDTPATVASVQAESPYEVLVKWSEPVTEPSATAPGNYSLGGGLTVEDATLVNPTSVRLLTSRQDESTPYTLNIQGVQDTTGNPSQLDTHFRSLRHVSGQVRLRTWPDHAGVFSAFASAGIAVGSPTLDEVRSSYYSGEGLGDTYFGQLRGWFTPDVTDNYVFFCASDDESELYLATDDNPATKQRIASVPGWTTSREWQKYPEQRSAAVRLEAGQRYYLELVWREGLGGDHGAVAVIRDGEAYPANGAGELEGNRIGDFIESPVVVARVALNLTSDPAFGGTIMASPEPGADGKYDEGTVITLIAAPADGFVLANWSGSLSATEPTTQITLNADANITANFRGLSAGFLQFAESYFPVGEGVGTVQFTVSRIGGSDGPASIDYQLAADGTATPNEDFTFTAGTLNWADGDMGAKSFTVEIIDESLIEYDETVLVELINPVGAGLSEPTVATVSIVDNEPMIVNVAPSFRDAGEVRAPMSYSVTPVIVPGWAYDISAGSPDEAGQNLPFVVTDISNPFGLFTVPPQISSDGTLTFTPAPSATGFAQFNVVLRDDGGTAFGGADTSDAHLLEIAVYRPNNPPVAIPGGPYEIDITNPNASLVLDGSASYDPDQALGGDGGIVSYSWDLNGDGVFGDATGPNPTVSVAQLSALRVGPGRYTIHLEVIDTSSVSATASTTLTISPYDATDTTPPTVTQVHAESPFEIIVQWNEPVTGASADYPLGYVVTEASPNYLPGYPVNGIAWTPRQATLVNPTTLRLIIRELTEGQEYWLSIRGVRDFGGNTVPLIVRFRAPRFVQGYTQTRTWHQPIDNIDTLDKFVSQGGTYLPSDREEWRVSFSSGGSLGDHYYGQLRGWFVPHDSGPHEFACSSDDDSRLYLTRYGPDGTPSRRQIAFVPGWTDPFQWDKYDEQISTYIDLEGGKPYYLELFWREIDDNDHAEVLINGRNSLDGIMSFGVGGVYVDDSDTQPPQLTSVRWETPRQIVLYWSEPLDPLFASYNYYYFLDVDGGPRVVAAELVNSTTVILTTDEDSDEGRELALHVSGWDLAGNGASLTTNVRAPRFVEGLVRLRTWNSPHYLDGDFERETIAYLPPDRDEFSTSFYSGEDLGDSYWGQLRAWFKPHGSGGHRFACSADDFARLYFGGGSYGNRANIATVLGWTEPFEWDKDPYQVSSPYFGDLREDQRYSLELVWREAVVGDHGAAAIVPDGVELVNGQGVIVNGEYGVLGTYVTVDDTLPRFALDLVIDPLAGSIQLDPPPGPDGKYEAGTQVRLTALPAAGHTFTGWTLTTPSAPGSTFTGWSGHSMDSPYSTAPSITMTIITDTTCTASFGALSVDDPPVAAAGSDQTLYAGADCTATLQLDGSASSDPDGDALTYSWVIYTHTPSGPLPSAPVEGAITSWTVSPGTYEAELTVSTTVDGQVQTASDRASITVLALAPTLTRLSPAAALAGGPAFSLTVSGGCFQPGATVYWNGLPRPTVLLDSGRLEAQISASDVSTAELITAALVTVSNGDEQVSSPVPFSIIAQSVGHVDALVIPPDGTASVSTAPTTAGDPGVSVAVQNNGGELITVTAATYSTEPVGATVFRIDDGSYVDVQINGADSDDVAAALFYYPSTISGTAEADLQLHYYNGAAWILVGSSRVLPSGELSPTPVPPVKDTTDNQDTTISGGRFTVIFDHSSSPAITELGGTVFGMFDGTPQIVTVTGPNVPVALGTEVIVTVQYAALGDPAAVRILFLWDDGTETTVEPAADGLAGAIKRYAAPGVYGLTVRVTDEHGATSEPHSEYVVIYDPNGGFVTGGGWIDSPAGAYAFDPTLSGKATFGFVSKYKKGQSVPTGETQFQFQAGDFKFQSTAYEWLVVSGAKAQYKGVGMVNGVADYGFLLTATDGQVNGGGGVDKFRIKIWDQASEIMVYDNVMGQSDDLKAANPQAIGGGSIVIHQAK